MDLTLTIATVPAVIALVTLAKDLGVPSKLGPLLAVVLGIVLSLFAWVATGNSFADTGGVLATISTGFILGLSASGLYDGAKAVGAKKAEGPEYVPEHAAPDITP